MGVDLGTKAGEVHAQAREVLDFWLGELSDADRFAKSDALDHTIEQRFGVLRDAVLASAAADWRGDPDTLLAAIILLDQFSRNIHRGSAEAFAADPLARELTMLALDRGWDAGMDKTQRQFLYLPLMHAEDRALQALSLEKFGTLGDDKIMAFAQAHADVIARYGRFPSRNAALGRVSTDEELAYLSGPNAGW